VARPPNLWLHKKCLDFGSGRRSIVDIVKKERRQTEVMGWGEKTVWRQWKITLKRRYEKNCCSASALLQILCQFSGSPMKNYQMPFIHIKNSDFRLQVIFLTYRAKSGTMANMRAIL